MKMFSIAKNSLKSIKQSAKLTSLINIPKFEISEDINNGQPRRRSGNPGCFVCGQIGHIAKDCTQSEKKCFNCGQGGHLSKDCPRTENSRVCYNCGNPGHLSRDCTERRITTCHKCGQEGHKSNACPNSNRNH